MLCILVELNKSFLIFDSESQNAIIGVVYTLIFDIFEKVRFALEESWKKKIRRKFDFINLEC